MRVDPSRLKAILQADAAEVRCQANACQRQVAAVHDASSAATDIQGAAYDSARDYLSCVKLPALQCQLVFLDALAGDLKNDGNALDRLGGAPLDTDDLEAKVSRYDALIATLDDVRQRDADAGYSTANLGRLIRAYGEAQGRLRRKLQLVYDYLGNTSIYARSRSEASRLKGAESALGQVGYDAASGSYDLSRVEDGSWNSDEMRHSYWQACLNLFLNDEEAPSEIRQYILKELMSNNESNLFGGDPVNLSTGNFIHHRSFLHMGGLFPVSFELYYNSLAAGDACVGRGWTHNLALRLERHDAGMMSLRLEDGHETLFFPEDGSYVGATSEGTLSAEPGGGWRYTNRFSTCYLFDPDGAPARIEDLDGCALAFSYGGEGLLEAVTSSSGEGLAFVYEDGLLVRIEDTAGRRVLLRHEDGLLTSVTDECGHTRSYGYDASGRMECLTNELGAITLRNEYDDHGRVARQAFDNGTEASYRYDDSGRCLTLVDQEGHETSYESDGLMRTVAHVREDGTERFEYDRRNLRISHTSRLGSKTTFLYDGGGWVSGIVNAEGERLDFKRDQSGRPLEIRLAGRLLARNTFDGRGHLVRREDALGRKVCLAYGAYGRLARLIRPDGSIVTFTRDDHGNATCIEDGLGIRVSYEYDQLGRVIRRRDAAGGVTRYEYDERDRVTRVTNALGDVRSLRYDACGNMVELRDFDGLCLRRSYDDFGLLREAIDKAGGVCTFEYDALWRLTSITDQLGATTAYAYDRQGRLEGVTNALGESVRYEYDADDRCTEVTYPNGTVAHMTYDRLGRVVRMEDCAGSVTSLSYNRFGQVERVTDPAGNSRCAEYDDVGQLVATNDEMGARTTFGYDALGRLASVTDPNGVSWGWEYLPGGLLGRSIAPGSAGVSYAYDACGRLSEVAREGGETLSFERDLLGRVTRATGASGWSRQYEYDSLGRCSSVCDAYGSLTSFGYDALGELSQVTDALGGSVSYSYDAHGCLVSMTRSDGAGDVRETCYERDLLGRIVRTIDPLGNDLTFSYDALGKLVEVVDEEGRSTLFKHGMTGALESVHYADGRKTSMRYDALGRVVGLVDWLGTTTLDRDAAGRVAQTTDPSGAVVTYDRDAGGRLVGLTYPNGRHISYVYDRGGRLSELATDDASVYYEYDGFGLLARKVTSGGLLTCLNYDPLGRLSSSAVDCPTGHLMDVRYCHDAGGRTVKKTVHRTDLPSASGEYSYAYDAVGRLVGVEKNGATLFSYEYDRFGNRLQERTDRGTASYTYDAADRLICRSTPGYIQEFSYDKRGNVLSVTSNGEVSQTFEYDSSNHLACASDVRSGRLARFTYNGLGKRASRLEVGPDDKEVVVRYVHDLSRDGRSLLLESGASSGDRTYLWDDRPLAAFDKDGLNWIVADELGSPLAIVGEEGELAGSASYDAFGSVAAGEGGLLGLGFSAYGTDSLTRLLHAEAREYSPYVGRFTSRDSRVGLMGFTQSLNRYAYCWNAPLGYVDVNGRWPDLVGGLIEGVDEVTDLVASPSVSSVAEDLTESFFEAASTQWHKLPGDARDELKSAGTGALRAARFLCEGEVPVDLDVGPISLHTKVDFIPYDLSDLWHDLSTNTDAGKDLLEAADFHRDEQGVYHTNQDCWQAPFGYNDSYDFVFKGFTSARPNKFGFAVGDTNYTLWLWKGDYYNLGAGAESGIYRGNGFHQESAIDANLYMKLNLYNSDGEAYFIYDPRKTNWWTNGFNPSIQDAHQEDLIAFGTVDFSASPSLWNGFYSRWKTTPGWCFDEEHKVAYYAW